MRERERGLKMGIGPPVPPDGGIHQGSDRLGGTGDQDGGSIRDYNSTPA